MKLLIFPVKLKIFTQITVLQMFDLQEVGKYSHDTIKNQRAARDCFFKDFRDRDLKDRRFTRLCCDKRNDKDK